jgi:hypothetical protein
MRYGPPSPRRRHRRVGVDRTDGGHPGPGPDRLQAGVGVRDQVRWSAHTGWHPPRSTARWPEAAAAAPACSCLVDRGIQRTSSRPVVDRERRPIGRSYVITQGTFLIGSLGNYLIADTNTARIGQQGQRDHAGDHPAQLLDRWPADRDDAPPGMAASGSSRRCCCWPRRCSHRWLSAAVRRESPSSDSSGSCSGWCGLTAFGIVLLRDRPRPSATVRDRPRPSATVRDRPRPDVALFARLHPLRWRPEQADCGGHDDQAASCPWPWESWP